MKKLIYVILGVALMQFSACQDFFDLGEEKILPKGLEGHSATTIQFSNEGDVAVSIYASASRDEDSKLAAIDARQESKLIDWTQPVPGTNTNFYLTYTLMAGGVKIAYTPSGIGGQFDRQITANTANQFKVPKITDSPDGLPVDTSAPLITSSYYLSIENTTAFTLKLQKGNNTVSTINNNTTIETHNTGVYKISDAGSYAVLYNNSTSFSLQGITEEFLNGRVYQLKMTYPAVTLTLIDVTVINIDNLGSEPSLTPEPGTGNEFETLEHNTWKNAAIAPGENRTYRFPVVRGKTYYIQWNDSFNGDRTKTADVTVSAYLSSDPALAADNRTKLFEDADNGWTEARSIPAQNNGFVFLVVRGYAYDSSGSFAVRYYGN